MKWLLVCPLLLLGFGVAERSQAQGVEHQSLVGGGLANFLDQSATDQPYNLRLGPVTLRADASFNAGYNDNLNVANTGRIADGYVEPMAGIHLLWQATELNSLSFDLGIGYLAYFEESQYDSLILSPDSQVQFNIFVGDVKINLHDNFAYLQDAVSVGQLSNVPQFDRFQNSAGISANWNLGDINLSADYEHANLWVFEPAYKYLSNQSDSISPQVSFTISPTITTGIGASFSDVRYDQHIQNNYTTVSVGPFVTAHVTDYLSLQASGGAYFANYDTGGLNGDSSNNDSYFASGGVSHRINDVLSESLTVGRESIPGVTSNYTDRIYANYGTSWQATSYIHLGSSLWWENLDDSNSAYRETSNRYGAGLNGSYSVTDHAAISLGYQYVLKVADPSLLSYYQNSVTLGFHYQF